VFCVLSCWLGNHQKSLTTAHVHVNVHARTHTHTHTYTQKPFRAWREVLWLSLLVSYAAQLPAFTGINRCVILTCIKDTVEIAPFIFDFKYHNDSLVEGMLCLDGGVGQILILDTQMGKTYCRMPWCIPKDKEDLAN